MKSIHIKILIILFVLYPPLITTLGLRYSSVYKILNPYSFSILLLIVLLIYYLFKENIIIHKVLIIVGLVYFLILFNIPKYADQNNYFLIIFKNIQFIWGYLLLLPGFIYLAKYIKDEKIEIDYYNIIQILLVLFSMFNIYEFFATNYFNISVENIPYLKNLQEIQEYVNQNKSDTFSRPVGILMYPQPNSFATSLLLVIYSNKFGFKNLISILGLFALIVTFSGTGMLFFLGSFCIANYNRIKIHTLLFVLLIIFGLFQIEDIYYRFSSFYINHLINILNRDFLIAISEFNFQNYLYGSPFPKITSSNAAINHDWAYLGIFEEQGIVGLIFYILLLYKLFSIFLPREYYAGKKFLMILFLIVINFHYPLYSFISIQVIISSCILINFSQS